MSRYFPRVFLIGAICLSLIISATSMVWASSPHITLSIKSGPPTSAVKVSGKHFGINEVVTITFDTTQIGTATTNSSGIFSAKITIPGSATPGMHTIQVTGNTSGLTASASFLVQTNWSTYGFDSNHTNVNPYENVLNPTNVAQLTLDWNAATGNSIDSEPAVVKNVLYIGSADHNFYAYNALTGALLWTAVTGGGIVFSSPTVVNSIVYVSSDDGKLYAFNAKTGTTVWTATIGGIGSSPTVVNGVVYVGTANNKVYSFEAKTGTTIWVTSVGTMPNSFTPTVSNGLVLLGSDRQMYALNAKTGTVVWSTPSNNNLYINSYPVVANGEVYVTVGDGAGYNEVDGFNISNGVLDWSFDANYIETAPTIDNQTMFFGVTGEIFAVDIPTRGLLWASANTSYFYTATMVANGVVYASDAGGNISALNASNGTTLWTNSLSPGYALQSSPIVVNGIYYIGSNDHHLYAFHVPNTCKKC